MDTETTAVQGHTDTAKETETTQETTDTTKTTQDTTTGNQETTKTEETSKATETGDSAPEIDPDKFTVPEGFDGLDQQAMQEFLPFAKELKLTQEQAQQVINLHAKTMQGAMKKMSEQHAAASEAGIAEVKTIFGANYEQNMGKIQHLLQEYGGEDAVQQPVYGNKALMGALLKIAEAAGPGRFIAGRQAGSARDADLLFDAKGDK